VSLQLAALIIFASSTNPSTNKRFQTFPSTPALARTSVPGNSARLRRKRFQTANRTRQAESQVMGARVGQRTTLDVLNAQQELVNARVALVTAQHDRVVASYTLLAAVGGLSMQRLGLNVMVYDPQVQVRDAWIGVRTPDGR
jgi:hypothetical protein